MNIESKDDLQREISGIQTRIKTREKERADAISAAKQRFREQTEADSANEAKIIERFKHTAYRLAWWKHDNKVEDARSPLTKEVDNPKYEWGKYSEPRRIHVRHSPDRCKITPEHIAIGWVYYFRGDEEEYWLRFEWKEIFDWIEMRKKIAKSKWSARQERKHKHS